ncbi:MAG: isoaspartyl peptidase/L-asparaginase family protein [Litorimonas sp.]
MTKYFLAALLLATAATPAFAQETDCDARTRFAIIVHGGTSSGQIHPERLAFIETMLAERRTELDAGARAIDIVEAALVAMEDSGLFNAGKAAITNSAGYVETDASIMDGRTLDAGAVASQRRIKNPISAARLVMDNTRHVMMVGDRGEVAVTALGAETIVPEDYFTRMKSQEVKEHGTVGAAVLDRCGDLAAGTSTGGYGSKIPGRVGDSPIIGAGVYAANGVMAGSATGHGEYFIRHTALRSVAARMDYGTQSLSIATQAVIDGMDAAGPGRDGQGGIVAVDANGSFAAVHSTVGMIHGMTSDSMTPMATQTGVQR